MKTYKERTQDILDKANKKKNHNGKIIKYTSIMAGFLAVMLTFNLVLFVPYQKGGIDITPYSSSQYYSIIKKLSPITHGTPKTTNNFKEWFNSFSGCSSSANEFMPVPDVPNDGASGPIFGNDSTSSGQQYNEVTNNQTNGVIEGDLFKRSDRYIYYLDYTLGNYDVIVNEEADGSYTKLEIYNPSAYILRVYSIAGLNSEQVASYTINSADNTTYLSYLDSREMYLSNDCNTVTVITPCFNKTSNLLYTELISIDVSNPSNIKETNRVYISGQYVSSRITDNTILLVSNFSATKKPDYSNEAQFLPQIGTKDGFKSLPLENIICPDDQITTSYTVISSLDANTLDVCDSVAFLSYSDEVYVSQDNLFVTRSHTVRKDVDNEYKLSYTYQATDIYCVSYDDGNLDIKGNIEISGTIVDRYCMDEYEGILRVFTNSAYFGSYTYDDKDPYPAMNGTNMCNLYCIDLNTFEIKAKAENFAPLGEDIKSARFDGTTAYVCTALYNYSISIEDPVFAFDLSDLNNITYKDTGTIPGYSLSLVTFKDNTLLGIGYSDSFNSLKIEIYRETNSDVQSVAKYELLNTEYSHEFKAYFIDKQNGLIGLAIRNTSKNPEYLLLHFDGYNLVEISRTELSFTSLDEARATFIDGYLYLFGLEYFKILYI